MDAQPAPEQPSPDLPRFPRGFVLTETPILPPVASWIIHEIAGLRIARAPELPLAMARSGRQVVVVLGQFVDTETWCSVDAAVARAADALARSEAEFLDVSDAWSGRYLVVFGDDIDRHVMTDATGMRAAFHALEGPFVVASHAAIVATVIGAPRSGALEAHREVVRAHRGSRAMAMAGRSTPWTGVVHLTANVALRVGTSQLRRMYPRRPLRPMTPAVAASVIAPRLRGQVVALVSSGRPVAMSITGGVDSRVSLAASRPVSDGVRYFTYRQADLRGNAEDAATAAALARAFRLPHRVVEVPPAVESPDLDAVIREATFLSHGRRLVAAYRSAFTRQTLHIRSNIGEVGRGYYRRTTSGAGMTASPAAVSAADLARLWAGGDVDASMVEAFADWMAATRFHEVPDLDALDLFYWEHRMACWHANVVLESDFAFDTHVLFNSRWILDRLVSVPLDDRCRGTVFRDLVVELWPELATWAERPAWQSWLAASGRRVRRRSRR